MSSASNSPDSSRRQRTLRTSCTTSHEEIIIMVTLAADVSGLADASRERQADEIDVSVFYFWGRFRPLGHRRKTRPVLFRYFNGRRDTSSQVPRVVSETSPLRTISVRPDTLSRDARRSQSHSCPITRTVRDAGRTCCPVCERKPGI